MIPRKAVLQVKPCILGLDKCGRCNGGRSSNPVNGCIRWRSSKAVAGQAGYAEALRRARERRSSTLAT